MALIGEYRTLTHTFKLSESKAGIAKDVQDELNRYCLDLPHFVDGFLEDADWEVNSHSLTMRDGQAILTIFFQRKTI